MPRGRDPKFLGLPAGFARAILLARGVTLAPLGSAQDRLMCAVVLRERQEKLALVNGLCVAAGSLLNVKPAVLLRSFDEYVGLMSRRDLDVEALREHVDELRRAHARIVRKQRDDRRLLGRLEAMGEYADRVWGVESTVPAAPSRADASRLAPRKG